MVLVAMYSASEAAKKHKTEALIARIDAVIRNKWESYHTRRVPLQVSPAGTVLNPAQSARARVDALHDLMRMELPDRWTDVVESPFVGSFGGPSYTLTRPAVSQAYKRRWDAAQIDTAGKPTLAQAQEFQGAECLYLILQLAVQEEGDDVSVILRPDNVGDKDQDGFPEIIDAWGTPIRFLRWAPGFLSEQSIVATSRMGGTPAGAPTGPHRLEFYIEGRTVPQSGAGIVGGAAIGESVDGGWNIGDACQITGYAYEPDTSTTPPTPRGRVICTTPTTVGNVGSVVSANQRVYLVPPDPFDYQGVYRKDMNTNPNVPLFVEAAPTFALYPLVYSAGPDKAYGIVGEHYGITTPTNDPATALKYKDHFVFPFLKPAGTSAMGYQVQLSTENGDWKDNLHNHALGRR
jgi:hypothetical protein